MFEIEVENLTKKFKETLAVNDISLEVNKGEILGLLGENGAGKTTTLRMLATMLTPTSGSANIGGHDLLKQSSEIRGKIGILFGSESGLYDRLTARENIMYFAELNGMDKTSANKEIDRLSSKFGMNDYIDKKSGKFSKGMKQKVCIIRSIIHNPNIMLFDEPTSGLDVSSSKIVLDFIKECRDEGKTIVFSSHTMSEVEKLCDRIAIIHKGKLQNIGTKEELIKLYGKDNMEDIMIELVGDYNE